jgi:polyferredoxin
LFLNVHRIRFWCRYICPLGALLGVCSRFTAFRVKNDAEVCTRCNLCAARCPSGSDPHLPTGWHRSECFYCWNCKNVCPVDAIRLDFETPSLRVTPGAPTGPHRKEAEETDS